MAVRDRIVGTLGVPVASLIITRSAILQHAWGKNNSAATIYLQFIDAAVLPADGAVTLVYPSPLEVGAGQRFDMEPHNGILFTNGVCIVVSSTKATKTIVAACVDVDVQYQAAEA